MRCFYIAKRFHFKMILSNVITQFQIPVKAESCSKKYYNTLFKYFCKLFQEVL